MTSTKRRKDEHIEICLRQGVGSGVATGLERVRFEHRALPEIDLDDVDPTTSLFGRTLRAPLILGAMTGGTARARRINERLARAAARLGVGMALGSQRAMIEHPGLAGTYAVRDAAPDLPLLLGNIGAVQLGRGLDPEAIGDAARAVGADVLAFHLNPLQEALQPEGDTSFRGLWGLLRSAIRTVGLPCIVKEVGTGISSSTARRLARLPLAGVETGGAGGTSWALVESYRAAREPLAAAARRLAGFGVPTAESIRHCRAAFGRRVVIGSGGVRTGHDVAAAIALGADAAALAGPLLAAAERSQAAVEAIVESIVIELRTILFCTGNKTPAGLAMSIAHPTRLS